MGQADSGDGPRGVVGLAVPGTVESVPGGLARRRSDRAHATQSAEAGLGADPLGVVPGGDEELGGDIA